MATDSDKSRYQLGVWQWLVSVPQPTGVQSLSLTSSSRLLTFLLWDNSSSDPCTTWLLNPGCYLSLSRPSSSPEVLGYRIYFCLFYGAASARVESRCLLMCEQETGLRVWFVLELQRWKWHLSLPAAGRLMFLHSFQKTETLAVTLFRPQQSFWCFNSDVSRCWVWKVQAKRRRAVRYHNTPLVLEERKFKPETWKQKVN